MSAIDTQTLSPIMAANIANQVYTVMPANLSMQDAYEFSGGFGLENEFEVENQNKLHGTSGPLFLKATTGFGYCAKGTSKKGRQREAVIALRGTASFADALTDGNIGLQSGPYKGTLVHAGFNDTYGSFSDDINSFLISCRASGINLVHCVGHSLGGALATLSAAVARENGFAAKLYTFGCPRVGGHGFASTLTREVRAENIFRAYHLSDPISMIPIFPFAHVPENSTGIQLKRSGLLINPYSHKMENYITSVKECDWQALRNQSQALDMQQRSSLWLKYADGVPGSVGDLLRIKQALSKILMKLAGMAVGTTFTGAVTVLDRLAWLLTTGAHVSIKIGEDIKGVLGSMLGFLGRVVSGAINVTYYFVKWVLGLLLKSLQTAAILAVLNTF